MRNPFFSPNAQSCRSSKHSWTSCARAAIPCGARVNVVASGVPVGWGEPVYGRLDADIAAAMMSINAVKGVEIGAGFASIAQKGSEHGDEMTPQGFLSNNNGGVLGGISTGQDVTRLDRAQADLQHPAAAAHDRHARRGDHRRDHRPARPLRRHPRDADRRGDAGLRPDGSRAAPPRAVRRRDAAHAVSSRVENPRKIN